LLKYLVIENKLVDYDYFMDGLQEYEVYLLIDYLPWAAKTSYEQTRLLLWGVLGPYMKVKKSPEQILPLATDNVHEKEKPLSDQQADEIRDKIMNIWGNGKQA